VNSEGHDLLMGSEVLLNELRCVETPNSSCAVFDSAFAKRDVLITSAISWVSSSGYNKRILRDTVP
jgi:hypothetical protein